ncbi:PAS domain S-box-containing protein/diguanylate cyclase (GGDEF)-like protein [Orenia metallireducens]|uniref:PAS domain S-box-containing protein/diguanylate cyclase (GGDEF) domain-containing protein n=1 Tax=Orenia metallireducens TaxID=1413210 RepID=A0A285H352_9FIRM|nr:diguanylate cyclase [Orenia metallireducens]PRX29463.1 PAS domain S-box-containing protein/diguanylate cyclase (GGDEF)-like protein [Orenia metallireducens]SNY30013.1 PAS domain S-box-containing protein/diguanylate cyclase (GGDEF) domain-containing protein [Orenia metallireducens]
MSISHKALKTEITSDLNISTNIYQVLFERTATAMLISDENNRIFLVNRELENLTGYTQAELEEKIGLQDFLDKEDLERINYYYKQRRKGDDIPNSYEVKIIDKLGIERTALLQINLISGGKRSIISLVDITERKKLEERMIYLGYHDDLTGLYNRYYYEEMIIKLDRKDKFPLSIIIADSNCLKMVNDTFGHEEGDRVIQIIADILQDNTREGDVVARWGGDEFGILLPNTSFKSANKIVERIRLSCREWNKGLITPSIALGVATKTDSNQCLKKIINIAENRMYNDKLKNKRSIDNSLILSLERSLLSRNHEIRRHISRVRVLALKFGKVLKLSLEEQKRLSLLARLHDIGKLGLPERVVKLGNTLAVEELKELKRHCEIGYRAVKNFQELLPIANSILFHHERWDGRGYPQGLQGKEIPLLARIISIIDFYEMMTRDYQKGLSQQEALEELKKERGKCFDPELVDEFINSDIF